MGEYITIDNRIGAPTENIEVASLSLQIVAENIFKHNIINENQPMTITLEFSSDKKELILTNCLTPKLSSAKSGIGLQNLSSRYLLLCDQRVDYYTDKNRQQFAVKIPLIYDEL